MRITYKPGAPGRWQIESDPDVRMRLRRIFASATGKGATISIDDTPGNAIDLEWILARYPHDMERSHWQLLISRAQESREQGGNLQAALATTHDQPPALAIPLRQYQLQAVEACYANKRLLCGDDLGLGKTAVGIGLFAKPGTLPAVVVCPTHLTFQWAEQIRKFLPSLTTTFIKTTRPDKEQLSPADVTIIPYSRIAGWRDHLKPKTIVFDECHALRKRGTQKYDGAKQVADLATYRLGLSATPVFNYGDELHNVMECISPGELGSYYEFTNEWCHWTGRHFIVDDPIALGTHIRKLGIMLRRTRSDVGRELPALTHLPTTVEFDAAVLGRLKDSALNLAAAVLHGTFVEKGQAARQLDILLRQATGIAKAPAVADFVADLVDSGEQVVCGAWHREVYTVILKILEDRGIRAVMYTGSESPTQKQAAKDEFMSGRAQVFLISLRSGEGLDGLQGMSRTVVIAELDWSPQPIAQLIGRVHRDGQPEPVVAHYLIIDNGSDPVIAGILGLKGSQSDGIVDLTERTLRPGPADDTSRATLLANSIIR